ncbi:MAG: aldehyde dehydrogenase, partial [Ramlibacter sp.]|nr:aldehyde dehydrogenase [Ramlibacter sp.]
MASAAHKGLTRRALLAGSGSLVLAFSLRPEGVVAQEPGAQGPKTEGPKLPGSLDKQPLLDAWIRIDADGKVTVFSGKAELGQGIKTALIQVAAEELMVKPERIAIVTADTQRTADEGYTAGSHSMQDSGVAIRNAAAQVRAILVGLAAQKLGVAAETLKVDDGVVTGGSRPVPYGELVSGQDLHVKASPNSPLRDPATYTVMGKEWPRVDIPAKVTGGAAYVQDLRLPDMVHGRIVRPPSPGATLTSVDSSAAEKLPGVLKVVRDGRFLAVIAQREWQAIVASKALARGARWQERETLPVQADLYKAVLASQAKDIVLVDRGTPDAGGGKAVSAAYLRPYQIHASIGPSCAVAQLVDGSYTVWTHSQGVYPLRKALMELLGQPEDKVRCIHTEGSGCYGHNAADDVAGDAALLARALPGRPVRVQWMREDEHMWEPYSPAMVTGARATLDANGSISSWQYEVWSNTHNARP